jgi:hypothetical protein
MSNISEHKKKVKQLNEEQEVLDWIDGVKPLQCLAGTPNGMRIRHKKALRRLVASGVLLEAKEGRVTKYRRIR